MIHPWNHKVFDRLWAAERPQGLLLTGPAGLGKGVLARHLAQAILCEGKAPQPCGICPSCGWFQAGNHPDFRLLVPPRLEEGGDSEGSVWITVDAVRALAEFLMTTSHRQGWRVILIEPAEALNLAAANALLKTLEEPPPQTLFLLVSHHSARIPVTVRSRCRLWPVPLPTGEQAMQWLHQEGVKEPSGYLRRSGGAPLRALEQFQRDHEGRLGFLQILTDHGLSLTQQADRILNLGLDQWLEWLQFWVMDLIGQKILGHGHYHQDFQEALGHMASRLDLYDLLAWETRLREARRWMNHPLNARLLTESLLAPLHLPS
ncbi:DNA polymerase III subunit delta' [Ferrovum myxofaciens]|jgi:DNA polymerase-3 subunit delta'|uniref:DNA polymerase III subunit delta n=2 Tax=root TaxID=1 RepID=A0A8F3IK81_9PROT|nr:DNA polymerase III subunit delta' [Ferrovum myxofaciens]MBW8028942.1 DNA polymerase III subunit delta' [Ferrovum sp.]KXW59277.1 DNA polymerase III subunit delta' [Ferrovum myxofaciens]MBU6993657.1 DNA polymerase III subunit delta' [Ferrovum myxofaciens]NDU89916.1 DNA polymerase III subunit delta' [Ferrovum sp.]QKE37639.1 MAG: DNA polymerase III subunit delta' [Ferrovum myxofaciens]